MPRKKYYYKNKEIYKEQNREYYEKNKDKCSERNKVYYIKNKKSILNRHKRYRDKPDIKKKSKNYQKAYYQKNKCNKLEQSKKYQKENKEKIRKYLKEYYKRHRDKIKKKRQKDRNKIRAYQRDYYKRNKEKINRKISRRLKEDDIFRLKFYLRNSIRDYFKKRTIKKKSDFLEIIGCDWNYFLSYLEKNFKEGMSFKNYGGRRYNSNGSMRLCWEIDHSIPLKKAKTEKELIKLNHYTNLKPLWWFENVKKGSKSLKAIKENEKYN